MTKQLTVNGNIFEYPETGDISWGEDSTAWAEAVTDVLNDLAKPDDILETSFQLTNNQSSAADITGMLFSTATVRSATIDYNIYINTSTTELSEAGELIIVYKTDAAEWTLAQRSVGDDSGLAFSITASGQVQYTTTNIGGTGYSGLMKFKARTLLES